MSEQRKRIIQLIESIPDEGLDDLEECVLDVQEFYHIRDNYNPEPASENEEIQVTLDE